MDDSKKVFTGLARFIDTRSAKIIEKIEAYQKADLDQGADLQEKLLLEITELQRRDGVQERLLQTEDNINFLQVYNFCVISSKTMQQKQAITL